MALGESAVRDAAKAKAEAQRILKNAEAIQREGNEAMDDAMALRSQLHLQVESDRQALKVERHRLSSLMASGAAGAEPVLTPPPVSVAWLPETEPTAWPPETEPTAWQWILVVSIMVLTLALLCRVLIH